MKRLFYTIFLTMVSISMFASGISKMYVQRNVGDQCVFFIFSQNLPAFKESKKIADKIAYDYTYAQTTDSVSMLITINLKNASNIDIVTIYNDNNSISSIPEIIYVKPKGTKMQYRIRVKMSFDEFNQIYNSMTPVVFRLSFSDLYGKTDSNFGYNEKNWKENSQKMRSIIELIKLNTNKK